MHNICQINRENCSLDTTKEFRKTSVFCVVVVMMHRHNRYHHASTVHSIHGVSHAAGVIGAAPRHYYAGPHGAILPTKAQNNGGVLCV